MFIKVINHAYGEPGVGIKTIINAAAIVSIHERMLNNNKAYIVVVDGDPREITIGEADMEDLEKLMVEYFGMYDPSKTPINPPSMLLETATGESTPPAAVKKPTKKKKSK